MKCAAGAWAAGAAIAFGISWLRVIDGLGAAVWRGTAVDHTAMTLSLLASRGEAAMVASATPRARSRATART